MKRQKLRKELTRHKWINVGGYVRLDGGTVNRGMALEASGVMLGSTYKVSRIVKDAGGYIIYCRRWNKSQRQFNRTPTKFSPVVLVPAEDPRQSPKGQRTSRGSRVPFPSAPRLFFPVGTPVRFKVTKTTNGLAFMGEYECGRAVRKGSVGKVTEIDKYGVTVVPSDSRDGEEEVTVPWDEAVDTLRPMNIK